LYARRYVFFTLDDGRGVDLFAVWGGIVAIVVLDGTVEVGVVWNELLSKSFEKPRSLGTGTRAESLHVLSHRPLDAE